MSIFYIQKYREMVYFWRLWSTFAYTSWLRSIISPERNIHFWSNKKYLKEKTLHIFMIALSHFHWGSNNSPFSDPRPPPLKRWPNVQSISKLTQPQNSDEENTVLIIIIIIMGSYNARLIYPIGYSRRRYGATAALIRQLRHTLTTRNKKYGTGFYGKGSDF